MKNILLVLVAAILICSFFVVSAEAKKGKRISKVKCAGRIVSCKRIAKSVCKKDKLCRAKAYKTCRASRKRTVKKVAKQVRGRKCKCNTKAALKCGGDEICQQRSVTKCVARCDSKRVRHVCKSVVRSACKQVALRVCATKKCARKAWRACRRAGKVRRVPRVCRTLARRHCKNTETGKKACRTAVKSLCVKRHAAHKKNLRIHKKALNKRAKKIAKVVCAKKTGSSRRRCFAVVLKDTKKYFRTHKKQLRKSLKKCACRYQAVKKCGTIGDGKTKLCKKQSIKKCQRKCLAAHKVRKNNCVRLAHRICKGKKKCVTKVSCGCQKGIARVRRHVKKSSVFRRCGCKVRALKKCGDDKVCRTTYKTKCQKKCAVKRTGKKLVKRHIRKVAKKLTRVVCKGKTGKKLRSCVRKVNKRVKRHFKKLARHHKRVLKGCACKQQATNYCLTVNGTRKCKKTFIKQCKTQCVKKLLKKAKRVCSNLSKKFCAVHCTGDTKCLKRVIKHCKKGAKRVRRVIVHKKKHVRRFRLHIKGHKTEHKSLKRKTWGKKVRVTKHLKKWAKKHSSKKLRVKKFKVNKFDCIGKAIRKCGLTLDGTSNKCRTKVVRKCHRRHNIRWTNKNFRRYYEQTVKKCTCSTRVAKKCATSDNVETCTTTKTQTCVAKCDVRRKFLKNKIRKFITKPSGCRTKSFSKCGYDTSEQALSCQQSYYSTCKEKISAKRVYLTDLFQLNTGAYVHPAY